jgi:hypothetical protein
MSDEELFEDGEERERSVEEVSLIGSAIFQRIVYPPDWGPPALVASAEQGAVLLFSFPDMPHLLCWRLPDDEDVIVELLPADDPRVETIGDAAEEIDDDDGAGNRFGQWQLPDDIDEERLHYSARWGRPSPLVEAWLDGGPLLLQFDDGQHIVRWELGTDILLSLIADDTL